MRRPSTITVPLTVELSPEAWRQIGALSGAEFSALRQHLDLLAATATEDVLTFRVGPVSGVCTRDLTRRVLRLAELTRVDP